MKKKRFLSICLAALSILILALPTTQASVNVFAASSPPKMLTGYIPSAVTTGQARLLGHHSGTDQLALAIGLPLRNEQALTQLLNEVSTPHNPRYGHYLTQAEANQAFNPTPQQERQVIDWIQSHGFTVTHTYPNHLLVDVTGTFEQVEHLLHITINDYAMQLDGKEITFYAPTNEPTVDGTVSKVIDSILGLDDYPWFHVDASPALALPAGNGNAHGSPPYYPQDFANAYDVNPLWNAGDTGVDQHIGIVLSGPPPSTSALAAFDAQTGAAPPNLQTIPVDGGSKYPVSTDGVEEAAMDVEYTSGMAPGATIDYYEAPDTKQGIATLNGLDDALNMAGMDANNNAQISDSWDLCEATKKSDPFTMKTEQIFESNTVTGHDYFFSSGDNGSACNTNPNNPCSYTDPYPQYPASSTYVTSIGGTTFNAPVKGGYPGEVAWTYTPSKCPNPPYLPKGSGGGYSHLFARPIWQVGFFKKKHRGYPDVAADADPNTGALVWYDSNEGPAPIQAGGTSLATPLWAGMMADVEQYLLSQGKSPLGFINPFLYEIQQYGTYPAYHDITEGTNGPYYQAGPGWDAVTGLGSPDLYNLAQDAASLDASNYAELTGVAAVSATDIWAVGYYASRNGSSGYQTLIEQWNGSAWNVVPSPDPNLSAQLDGVVAVSANDIWAVGYYNNAKNLNYQYTLIEHWNGSAWNVVPSPSPDQSAFLTSVTAVSANDVWAVGNYGNSGTFTLIEQWNGSAWNVVPSPSPNAVSYLYSVAAVSATDVWAVGGYANVEGGPLIEQWNGSAWNVVPSPSPGQSAFFASVTAVSTNDVWAIGGYSNKNGTGTLIEQWNGSAWNVVPSPSPGQYAGMTAISATDVWAVGHYGEDTSIEQWNGSAWNVVSSPSPGQYDSLASVAAVSATDVWAVGYYNGAGYTLIEQWNGSAWNVVPSPNLNELSKR